MPRATEESIEYNARIGGKIKEIRIAKGMSRQQLAGKIDVTHQQLSKYEGGSNRVSACRLLDIAKALNKPILEFYDDDAAFIGENTAACIQYARNFMKLNPGMQATINQLIRQVGA